MALVMGNGRAMNTDTITPGEIECCRSCTTYASLDPWGMDMSRDLEFMRLRHADHQVNPRLYPGWPT